MSSESPRSSPTSTKLPFSILFEDVHLIVLSKPAGLLSQGEHTGDPNLVDELRAYLGRNYVGLVHRLDRNTSGLMVVAKRSKAADRLTKSLQNGELKRAYLAWMDGHLETTQTWRHLLLKDEKTNTVRVVTKHPSAKSAVLKVTPLKKTVHQGELVTLARFDLETGRSHQIRVQAAAEKHALLGDIKYGGRPFSRVALHSAFLEFPHPMSGELLKFEDALPADLQIQNF